MRFEPPLDRADLLAAVRAAYDIPVRSVTFLPVGLGSAIYVADAGDGGRRVLKVWTHLRLGEPAAARQHASLILTRALHERVLEVSVPYPLPARDGGVWADLAGMPFALFPYLPGETPERWPVTLCEQLGRIIAAIHRATPVLADVHPPQESFAIAFEADLRRDLDAAAQNAPDVRPGLGALRRWTLAHRSEVLAQLARLHGIQAAVRQRNGAFVLCHTDLHGGNLLVDHAGRLAVLDWDDAKLAPPEHDLAAGVLVDASGAGFAAVLDGYRRANGAAPLQLAGFAFYLLRRHLEDVAVCLRDLLAPDADEREDAAHLRLMDEECVVRWRSLDATLATIAAALDTPPPPGVR